MSIGLLPNFFFIGSPEAQAFREVRVRFLLSASYLSAAPHAEPHADGVSAGLSAAPHAVPHDAGVSSGFPAAPHAVPHADAGASSIFLLHPNRFKSDIFCSSFFVVKRLPVCSFIVLPEDGRKKYALIYYLVTFL